MQDFVSALEAKFVHSAQTPAFCTVSLQLTCRSFYDLLHRHQSDFFLSLLKAPSQVFPIIQPSRRQIKLCKCRHFCTLERKTVIAVLKESLGVHEQRCTRVRVQWRFKTKSKELLLGTALRSQENASDDLPPTQGSARGEQGSFLRRHSLTDGISNKRKTRSTSLWTWLCVYCRR